jgi:hypothetical protein
MKEKAYWATTAIIGLELIAGGLTDLAHGQTMLVVGEPVVDVLGRLGYPTYLLSILGVFKLLGAAAILAPRLPRLKEWAYAGTVLELTGAALSGLVVGNSLDIVVTPSVFAAIAFASWALRPQSRIIGELHLPTGVARRGDQDGRLLAAGDRPASQGD